MTGQTGDAAEAATYLAPRAAGQRDAWTAEAARGGRLGTQRLVEVRELVPPRGITAALGLEEGESAVVRRRVMYLDHQPVELTDAYYPASIARGTPLAEARRIPGGAAALVAELGYVIREVVEDVTAGLPAPEARQALALSDGDPVLVVTRTSMTAELVPIEVSQTVMPRGRALRYRTRVG